MSKPVIAFTCGDPGGIGPRAVVGALRRREVRSACEPVVIGEEPLWRRAGWRPALCPLIPTRLGVAGVPSARPSREGGLASFAAVRLGTRLALRGAVRGLVTAPISKQGWALAGVPFTDHTEYFRKELAVPAHMILCAPERRLWCVLATRHLPLSAVPGRLEEREIVSAAAALRGALSVLGRNAPRLGLCALNPHGGEEGLLGREEKGVLRAAAARVRGRGIDFAGPIAADTAWRWHAEGKLDGLVCLYHDQALIPLKVAAGLGVVNWTVGLPFTRTSPGHGTGFDIAGSRSVDCGATAAAALLAARLLRTER